VQADGEQTREAVQQIQQHVQADGEQTREAVQQIQQHVQADGEQTREAVQQIQQHVQADGEQTREAVQQAAERGAAITDAVRQQVAQAATAMHSAEKSHAALLQSSIHVVEQFEQARKEWMAHGELLRACLRSLDEIGQRPQENRATVELLQTLSGEMERKLQACLDSIHETLTGQTALLQQNHEVRADLAALSSLTNDAAGHTNDVLAHVAALHHYTRTLMEEQVVRQICLETSDYDFANPETGLMAYLYSYLPTNKVLDVGAHVGDVSDRLLKAGYEVWAFEPFPPSYEKLRKRHGKRQTFHPFRFAVGRVEAELPLHLATDRSENNRYDDSTVFNSLAPHSMPDDLPFTDTVLVPVKTLANLHKEGVIPPDISMAKIDTEGYDLEVVRGMGEHRYPVVCIEFWDTRIPFGKSGLLYTFDSAVGEMRSLGYPWFLALYRIWGRNHTAFYCNRDHAVPESWGNILFFRNYDQFAQAQAWCSAVLPRTYFKPAPAK
jgi:FkbM family methyltransferase